MEDYSNLFDYIYRYIRSRIHDPADCEDLVSEIFVKAVEKTDHFDSTKGSMKQWLTGIARHHLLNYWQRHKLIVPLDDIEISVQPDFDQLHFNQLIDHLPAAARQLLLWHYVDDLTYKDIAKLTNKSPAAIRQWFSRIHSQLRQHYSSIQL